MTYISNHPTIEKRRLFEFLERNKRHGVIGLSKVLEYLKERKIRTRYDFTMSKAKQALGGKVYKLLNQQGNLIGKVMVNKIKQINWWYIN